MTNTPERKRRAIPPSEKALENVLIIERQISRLDERVAAKRAELAEVEKERAPLNARLQYALANPDLDPAERQARDKTKVAAEGPDAQ